MDLKTNQEFESHLKYIKNICCCSIRMCTAGTALVPGLSDCHKRSSASAGYNAATSESIVLNVNGGVFQCFSDELLKHAN